MRIGSGAMAAMALVLAGGCGSESASDGAAGAASAAATSSERSDAVAAVLHSEGSPLARVSFVIEARPQAGKPFAVKLLVTPAESLPSVQLSAESTTLVAAPAAAVVTFDDTRGPVTHDLIVTGPSEGLTDLTVRLKSEDVSSETVYLIPVLVAKAD